MIVSQRAVNLGCNARLPVHGAEIREAVARLTLSSGQSGFGWTSLGSHSREEARRLLGQPLEQLISVRRGGVSEAGRAVEGVLWDLLGQVEGRPVFELLAEVYGGPAQPVASVYFTHLCFSDLGIEDDAAACAVLASDARAGLKAGHTAFKMKVRRGHVLFWLLHLSSCLQRWAAGRCTCR